MSSDETPNVPAARNSREAVREKAQQLHAKQSRARIMRRVIISLVAIVAVGAVGTAVAYAVNSSISKPVLNPKGMQDDGVTVTNAAVAPGGAPAADDPASQPTPTEAAESSTPEPTAAAPTEIHIYVDYLSAAAADFERANARQLAGWIDDGAVQVTYHPVALLTASSNGTKYSLRAASAAACVATYAADKFYDYNHELLTDQPKIDTDGRTDAELGDLAIAVGVDNGKKIRSCIEDRDFVTWAKNATARAMEGPLAGSDDLKLTNDALVIVAGKPYVGALNDAAEFSQFVLTTASGEYYGTSTPTPTPTPTESPEPTETPTATETPAS